MDAIGAPLPQAAPKGPPAASLATPTLSTEELILNTAPASFHELEFWDKFYESMPGEAFEWYGSWADVRALASGALRRDEPMLVIGCGNSTLSEDIFADGFGLVTSMDYSELVIEEMRLKTSALLADEAGVAAERRHLVRGLRWEVMDVTALPCADDTWQSVVDKGTLDALYAEETEALTKQAVKMLEESKRVIQPGGSYVLVTMAQPFLLRQLLGCFLAAAAAGAAAPWTVDIHAFSPSDGPRKDAYLVICTNVPGDGRATLHGADLAGADHVDLARSATLEEALSAVNAAQQKSAAIASACMAASTVAPAAIKHDVAMFERDDDDDEDDDGPGLSAMALAALADFAVDSGIVDAADPSTLVNQVRAWRGSGADSSTDEEGGEAEA